MQQGNIRFINEKEVTQLITAPEVFDLVEDVLKTYAKGEAVNPVKLSLQIYPYHEGHINSMPSYIKPGDLAGVKVVSVHQDNPKNYGLPTTLGTIILHNPDNGLPYAIMGGTQITNLRTGAVSGVKAKWLARPDSRVLCVIGAGAQGFASMEMVLLAMKEIEEIRICDLNLERCEKIIAQAKALYPNMKYVACSDSSTATDGADIVLYATSASVPLLEGAKLSDGVTVICVSEKLTPKAIARFDGFYVDFTACAIERYNADGRHTAEKLGLPYEDLTEEMVTGEIGDVMIGKTVGRTDAKQKILTAAVGMSIEDVIVAHAVYEAAVRENVGVELPFQNA